MSEFIFDYPLQASELIDCLKTTEEIAKELFGPVSPFKSYERTERLLDNGAFASLTRQLLVKQGEVEGVCIQGEYFRAQSVSFTEPDEDDGDDFVPKKVFSGTTTSIMADTVEGIFTANHYPSNLNIDVVNGIYIEEFSGEDTAEDGEYDNPMPALSDQISLAGLRAVLIDGF